MYPRPVLSSQDAARLRALIRSKKLPPPDKAMLLDWLAAAAVARKEDETFDRVCLHDRVTLVSPVDSRDWFKLTVVLPEDHDAEAGRLSVTCDIARAVLGRRCGERVSWQAPPGFRHMSIASVAKFDAFVR
jgi:regulator of nucleoside diphosphate kinase